MMMDSHDYGQDGAQLIAEVEAYLREMSQDNGEPFACSE